MNTASTRLTILAVLLSTEVVANCGRVGYDIIQGSCHDCVGSNIDAQVHPLIVGPEASGDPVESDGTGVQTQLDAAAPDVGVTEGSYDATAAADSSSLDAPTDSPQPDSASSNDAVVSVTGSSNQIVNGSFEGTATQYFVPWQFDVGSNCSATIARDATVKVSGQSAVRVDVTRIPSQIASAKDEIWVWQGNLTLAKAQTYTINFWARADRDMYIRVLVISATMPYVTSFATSTQLTTSWQNFTYTVQSPNALKNQTLSFGCNHSLGAIWLDDVTFSP